MIDWRQENYNTHDELYADDINKIITFFNSILKFETREIKGLVVPSGGLTLYPNSDISYKYILGVDDDGTLYLTREQVS